MLTVCGTVRRQAIVTKNVRDLASMELRFPQLRIVTPEALSKE